MGMRVLKFFGIGAATLAAVLALVLLLVLVGAFPQSVARIGLWAAGNAAGYDFACEEFEGNILSSFTCREFSASDEQGMFLDADLVEFEWQFLPLLSRQLNVDRVRIAAAALSREPTGEESGDPSSLPGWPGISIVLGEFSLQEFAVNLPGAPVVCLNGLGSAEIAEPILNLDVQFARCASEGSGRVLLAVEEGEIDADVQISDDGDLASLVLGWDGAGATNIRLVGAGPLNAFTGSFDAQIENGGTASLDVGTLGPDDNAMEGIGIAGEIVLAEGRAPSWAPATNGMVSAQVFFGEQGALRVENGRVVWGNAEFDFVFLRSDVGALSGQVEVGIGPYDGDVLFQSAEMSLGITGDADQQSAAGTYALGQFCAGRVCADEFEGDLQLDLGGSVLAFETEGAASALRVTSILDDVLGQRPSYDIAGNYAFDDDMLDVEGMLEGAQGNLELSAQMRFSGQRAGSGTARVDIDENAELLGTILPAALSVSADVEEFLAEGPIAGTIGMASGLFDGSGSFALFEDETLDVTFETTRVDPALLSQMTGYSFAGPPALTANVGGTSDLPIVMAQAVVPELGLGGLLFTSLQWGLDARRMEGAWIGETSLGSQSSAGAVDLHAELNWPDELPLEISVQESRIAEASIAGEFALPPGEAPGSGMFRVTGNPLSPLGQILDQSVASNGAVEIDLQTGGDDASVDIELALAEVRFGGYFSGAALEGDLAYNIAAQHAEAQLRLSEGVDSLSLEAAADMGAETSIVLQTLEGSWAGTPLRLVEPAMLRRSDFSTTLPEAVFSIGGGRAEISGNGNQSGVEARIALISIPVEPIMDLRGYRDAQGEINAELYARMTQTASEGRISLSLNDFAFANIAREVVPADFDMRGIWDGSELSIDGEVSGLDEVPAMFSASLPLRRAQEGYSAAVQNDAPISGAFSGSARAERFLVLLPIAEHSLTGLISASLQLGGTPADPVFTGRAALQDGTYESLEIGTRLEELNLSLEAAPSGALSFTATGTDGGAGRLSASGTISFDENAQPFGSANIEIANAYLAQRDEYAARGSGEINFEFPEGGTGAISGMITTSEVRVDLGQPLPPGIEEIDVEEINRPAELGALTDEEPSPEADFISMTLLDIDIDMPNNIRVEGYGVEAIWEGNIEIGGTVGMPAISGEINLARGIAEFLGRQFTLDEGSVIPDPSAAGNARIDISGSHEQNDLRVEVNISGPAASPEITWSSVPALPRDEIISRLYFGRASPQLTAYEAIQLAQLSGALGGLGGPGGVVGFARRVAGLDVLRIEPPEGGDIANPTVTVGKYVTDRVYVGARRDADTSSGAVEVEVEITPNISAEVETGSDDSQAAGVNWHWHY